MRYSINHGPYHATLDLVLDEDEEVYADPESMVIMSDSIEFSNLTSPPPTRQWWGSMNPLTLVERLDSAVFRAQENDAFLSLAPRFPGGILHLKVDENSGYCVNYNNYLAHTDDMELVAKYVGINGVQARKGVRWLQTEGEGDLFCSSYGAIVRRELEADESYVIDNRFIIAFRDTIELEIVRNSRAPWKTSGICRYTGPGELYYSTRGKPAARTVGDRVSGRTLP